MRRVAGTRRNRPTFARQNHFNKRRAVTQTKTRCGSSPANGHRPTSRCSRLRDSLLSGTASGSGCVCRSTGCTPDRHAEQFMLPIQNVSNRFGRNNRILTAKIKRHLPHIAGTCCAANAASSAARLEPRPSKAPHRIKCNTSFACIGTRSNRSCRDTNGRPAMSRATVLRRNIAHPPQPHPQRQLIATFVQCKVA